MKALAGVNIRQYERAAHAVAEYNRTVEMGLQIALQRLPAACHAAALCGRTKAGRHRVRVGSGHVRPVERSGGCACLARSEETGIAPRRPGDHGGGRARGRNSRRKDAAWNEPWWFRHPSRASARPWKQVLRKIEEWHSSACVEFVVLFYARPVSGAWYRVRGVRLLPVDEEWINGLRSQAMAVQGDSHVHAWTRSGCFSC